MRPSTPGSTIGWYIFNDPPFYTIYFLVLPLGMSRQTSCCLELFYQINISNLRYYLKHVSAIHVLDRVSVLQDDDANFQVAWIKQHAVDAAFIGKPVR